MSAHGRRRVAGFGGPVTKLRGPVSCIRSGEQLPQPLDAAIQLGTQLFVGSVALGYRVVALVGAAFPLVGGRVAFVSATFPLG